MNNMLFQILFDICSIEKTSALEKRRPPPRRIWFGSWCLPKFNRMETR